MSFIAQKRIKPKLKRLGIIIIGLYITFGMALFFLQEKILFRPSVLPQEHVFKFDHDFEELFLTAKDNAVINALHFKVDNPLGVILYFHGNAGNLQRWGSVTEYFVELEYDVLIMDYRTYGKSSGSLSESVLYEDGQMCYNYLLQRYSENDIILYGRSLGGGIATKIASDNQPKSLILESPFYSVADVARHRFPIFPVGGLPNYKFPNYQYLKKVNCPVTIFHGTEDKIVPFSSGKKLVSESINDQIEFIAIKGGGHNDLIEFEAYNSAIETILKE